jgi:hypothetical protein
VKKTCSLVALAALLLFLLTARASRAEGLTCPSTSSPGSAGTPWVRLVFEGERFTPSLRASVVRQIGSDLERRGLGLCVGDAPGEAAAELRLVLLRDERLAIELRDEVSQERFAREISLTGVPADALGLSIAVAGEELLHASWTQNTVAPAAPPPTAATAPSSPPRIEPRSAAGLSSDASSPSSPRADRAAAPARSDRESTPQGTAPVGARVSLLGAGEAVTQGQTAVGADVGVAWGARATIGARAGFRLAPEATSPHGAVGMREGIVRLRGAVALVPREAAWGGEIVLHGDAIYVELDGVASPAARALRGSATGVVLGGGLGGWARVATSWSFVGELTAGSPLHSVTASDSGTVVTGIRGLVIGFAVGVETHL